MANDIINIAICLFITNELFNAMGDDKNIKAIICIVLLFCIGY
jgi:hypothetical protein